LQKPKIQYFFVSADCNVVTKSKCSRHVIDCASQRIRLLSKIRFRLGYLLRQPWLPENICPINGKVLLKWPHFHELRDARILQKVTSFRSWKSLKFPGLSRPREFHPRPLRKPDVNLSVHPAPIIQPHGNTPRCQWMNKSG